MAMKEIASGTVIYESGQAYDKLLLIARGCVRVSFPGGSFLLKNGDIVCLADINSYRTSLKYETVEKTTVMEYPYESGRISELINANKDAVKYFLSSLFHQIDELSGHYKLVKNEYASLKDYLNSCYDDYKDCCERISISAGELTGYEELQNSGLEELLPDWITGYYATLRELVISSPSAAPTPEFLIGLMTKSGKDLRELVSSSNEIETAKSEYRALLMNESKMDLFELFQSLYLKAIRKMGPEDETVGRIFRLMNDLLLQIETEGINKEAFFETRKAQYDEAMRQANEIARNRDELEEEHGKEQLEKVSDSLGKILSCADVSEELAKSFTDHVNAYKHTVNKNGTEDDIRKLRLEITKEFNEIYASAFVNYAEETHIPTLLKMFFSFGYVDEELAGIDNAVYLYELADKLPSCPEKGVYSMFEWLLAIYNGKKDPGRNEFDVDFADFLHEEMRNKRITKAQEQQVFADPLMRVKYEIENVFPSVNKTTTGRITTFCPLFSEHNVLKSPDTMLVTADAVIEKIKSITDVDFGAYYRQTVFSSPDEGVSKEFINVEILPDIILAPNIGNRGIMWQEIEGKRRTTPARMFLSIFQQEDVGIQLIRLTGQFRWEMCKRVQGARWNDITERSLTSEYFDYVQYYRKNNELSPDAKDKIKNDMARCKNSFREMFIRDYLVWIQFESQGAPRLNKVARSLLFTYVPFSAACREKLKINPMYKDMIEHYEVKQKAKIHRLENFRVKLKNMGKGMPRELEEEINFIKA